jgi:ATP/maltotriose-dependent transcriptional regulator MalT
MMLEIDNVRSALTFALDRNDDAAALNLAIATEAIWHGRSLLREGIDWLSRSLVNADDLPTEIVADAFTKIGIYAFGAHDYDRAESAFKRAIDLYVRSGNQLGVAEATLGLSWSAIYEGRYELAEEISERVIKVARDVNNRQLLANVHETMSLLVSVRSEFNQAINHCQRALELYRLDGDGVGTSHALGFLGTIALWKGDLELAEQWTREALTVAEGGWEESVTFANELLGYIQLERMNYHEAGALIRTSLAQRDPNENGMVVAECFEGLAGVAAGLGDPERGAILLGAAEAMRERFRTPIPPPRQGRYDRTLAAIKAQMSSHALEAAWRLGRSLSGNEAASYALEPDSPAANVTVERHDNTLSAREVEVLRLVADGLSDREIAESLFISRHTVAHHVTSILNKLGVASRTAAATYAVREHLV